MKDIVAIRKYAGKDGQEKKEFINVGILFEKDGRQSVCLRSHINFGAFTNEKGEVWLNVYEHQNKQAKSPYKGTGVVEAVKSAVEQKEPVQEDLQDEYLPF